jgi:hypothetical protein
MAAPGQGNMIQYQNLSSSALTPAAIAGGKKRKGKKGGAVMDMAVPALLVLGNHYVGKKGVKLPFGVTDKMSKMLSRKKR